MEPVETIVQTAPTLRKYFYECVVIVLSFAVVYLFIQYNDLNKFIRTEMTVQINRQTGAIERNTDALNVFIVTTRKNGN